MHKIYLLALSILTAALLVGCGSSSTKDSSSLSSSSSGIVVSSVDTSEDSSSTSSSASAVSSSSSKSVSSSPSVTTKKNVKTPLTAKELDWFQNTFFYGPKSSDSADVSHNQFLTCTYHSPKEIDLSQLLYCGIPGSAALSNAEKAALKAQNAPMDLDCTHCTTDKINAFLKKNTGISLNEIGTSSLKGWIYLAKYDTYYTFHSDTNLLLPLLSSGWKTNKNTVTLRYTSSGIQGTWEVTLTKMKNGSYQFASNLSA